MGEVVRLSIFEVRKNTFRNWPQDVTQKSDSLAAAGFYFTGNEDTVECFSCGIEIGHWGRYEEPWIEHIKHSPKCKFVSQEKGPHFVEQVEELLGVVQSEKKVYNQKDLLTSVLAEIGYAKAPIELALNDVQRQYGDVFDVSQVLVALRQSMVEQYDGADANLVNTKKSKDTNNHVKGSIRHRPAIESVLEMGYGITMVRSAENQLRKLGKTEISAEDILKYILEEYDGENYSSKLEKEAIQNVQDDTDRSDGSMDSMSTASQSVIEIGYSKRDVISAENTLLKKGIKNIKAIDILSMLDDGNTKADGSFIGMDNKENERAEKRSKNTTRRKEFDEENSMVFTKQTVMEAFQKIYEKDKDSFTSQEVLEALLEKQKYTSDKSQPNCHGNGLGSRENVKVCLFLGQCTENQCSVSKCIREAKVVFGPCGHCCSCDKHEKCFKCCPVCEKNIVKRLLFID